MTRQEISIFESKCLSMNIPKNRGFKEFGVSEYDYYKSKRLLNSSSHLNNTNNYTTSNSSTSNQLNPSFLPIDVTDTSNTISLNIKLRNGNEMSIDGSINTHMVENILAIISK